HHGLRTGEVAVGVDDDVQAVGAQLAADRAAEVAAAAGDEGAARGCRLFVHARDYRRSRPGAGLALPRSGGYPLWKRPWPRCSRPGAEAIAAMAAPTRALPPCHLPPCHLPPRGVARARGRGVAVSAAPTGGWRASPRRGLPPAGCRRAGCGN